MITLDEEFLAGLGLGDLPAEDQRSLLGAIYEQLELTVGMRLAQRLSENELLEFEALVDAGDEGGLSAWLEGHVPDYPEVIRGALDEQMAELRQRRAEILEAAGVDVAR